jgi:hypothetical protein
MTAYNAAGESVLSNEIQIAAVECIDCSDGNPCTEDGCFGPLCTYVLVPDGTDCITGVCRRGACRAAGCLADRDCDDGNWCNGAETCSSTGACAPGTAPACGLATACEQPVCDPLLGCKTQPLPDGTACDDGDPGTAQDACRSGACSGCAAATSRDYALRWIPGAGPAASGFRVYFAEGSAAFGTNIDLGAVAPGSDGIARATVMLNAFTAYRAEMTAYNTAGESARSNTIQIAPLDCAAALAQSAP